MNIYLDVSCLNRPFDDQTQGRIHMESEAVLFIISRFEADQWRHSASEMTMIEIWAISDESRRSRVAALLPAEDNILPLDEPILQRAEVLRVLGLPTSDATHVAAAEASGADVFLTCDDPLLRRATRIKRKLKVRVANPYQWLQEQFNALNS